MINATSSWIRQSIPSFPEGIWIKNCWTETDRPSQILKKSPSLASRKQTCKKANKPIQVGDFPLLHLPIQWYGRHFSNQEWLRVEVSTGCVTDVLTEDARMAERMEALKEEVEQTVQHFQHQVP